MNLMQLREVLHYEAGTGRFIWAAITSNRARIGAEAGTLHTRLGYRFVKVFGRRYAAHRLAWFYVHGAWPAHEIDHINGIRDDNRIANLRDVSGATNRQNIRGATARNRSGLVGVSLTGSKSKPWRASISVGGRSKWIGHFATADEAHAAYVSAKRALHAGNTL